MTGAINTANGRMCHSGVGVRQPREAEKKESQTETLAEPLWARSGNRECKPVHFIKIVRSHCQVPNWEFNSSAQVSLKP